MSRNEETGDSFEMNDRRWTMGTSTLSKSFELESWSYVQHKDYQLQLLQKKEIPSTRSLIPTTTLQRLAYFSAYITLTYKREIVTTSQIIFTIYIASVTLTMLLKVLPHYVVVAFLSSYSPEEHLYVSKMVPLFWGCNLQIILSTLFSLVIGLDAAGNELELLIDGFYEQLPWTRCPVDNNNSSAIKCFDYPTFKEKVLLPTTELFYVTFKTTEIVNNRSVTYRFANSFMNYFGHLIYREVYGNPYIRHYVIRLGLGLVCALSGLIFFHKYFWKMLNTAYWALNLIYLFCLLYVLLKYLENEVPHIKRTSTYIPKEIIYADFSSIGLSMTAPPVLHVLFARSVQPINPNWDSGVLVVFCFIYVIFLATVDFYVKLDVEADIGFAYNLPHYNMYSSIYFYPLFFSFLPLGDFVTMIFFGLRAFSEIMILAATFQCFVEVLYCEWPWRVKIFRQKKWMISVIILLTLFTLHTLTSFYVRIYLYAVNQIISCLLEILIITLFYPIGRLMDDITFHQGSPPAKLRFYTLLLLPLYYTWKSYISLYYLISFPSKYYNRLNSFKAVKKQLGPFVHAYWLVSVIPIAVGVIYAVVKYIIIMKKKWSGLLRPLPTWGPRDHVTRQLRKQYDSRDYIPSQSSRYLARHMLAKAEADTYRIDIRYESAAERRRSMISDAFKMENEKKQAKID